MSIVKKTPPRGRPPTITRARIAETGIAIGLPNITFVGTAAALGVSHMALYKHVPNLEALKRLVAEEIFNRWQLPEVIGGGRGGLEQHLVAFVDSVRVLVKAHPGLAPYFLRRTAASPQMLTKIASHQGLVAHAYGIPADSARWVLSTVAFHCIAVADTVYAITDNPDIRQAGDSADEAEIEAEFELGMRALIVGALVLLENMPGK